MKRHLLASVIVCLLAFVCLCGFFLWRYANANLAQGIPQKQDIIKEVESNGSKNEVSWVNKLANLTPKEYILAANEIFIEFKNSEKDNFKKRVYQLIIDKNDIYSMLCLSQTLKNISVDFSVIKENSKNLIYINTQDVSILNRVIDDLKTYDIHSQIMEVKL